MGAGVSGWKLARAVSLEGQLGVVSGTALDVVLARRLQQGDLGGHLRRALKAFPFRDAAERILDRYFIEGGKPDHTPFKPTPMLGLPPGLPAQELTVAASFAHVYLAKEGHSHPVGINLLEKIKLPTLYVLFGAMLAGVDVVLMGAGIPRHIPGILDQLAAGQPAAMQIIGDGPEGSIRLDPKSFGTGELPTTLKRPAFLAIVSSPTLARHLILKSSGQVDGFVVEGPTAGGHNAPPRGNTELSLGGEPVYGPRDTINASDFNSLGLPFWLAGGYARPGGLARAQAEGAVGIQVGTAFAFCEESGIAPSWKQSVLNQSRTKSPSVFTDPQASPTGFPFKTVCLEGSLSDPEIYAQRKRVCDIGLLREPVAGADGKIQFRCPAEPPEDFSGKGGAVEQTCGRKCLCNGLMATIGLGQFRIPAGAEPALVTAGDDIDQIFQFCDGGTSYSARDVIRLLQTG